MSILKFYLKHLVDTDISDNTMKHSYRLHTWLPSQNKNNKGPKRNKKYARLEAKHWKIPAKAGRNQANLMFALQQLISHQWLLFIIQFTIVTEKQTKQPPRLPKFFLLFASPTSHGAGKPRESASIYLRFGESGGVCGAAEGAREKFRRRCALERVNGGSVTGHSWTGTRWSSLFVFSSICFCFGEIQRLS